MRSETHWHDSRMFRSCPFARLSFWVGVSSYGGETRVLKRSPEPRNEQTQLLGSALSGRTETHSFILLMCLPYRWRLQKTVPALAVLIATPSDCCMNVRGEREAVFAPLHPAAFLIFLGVPTTSSFLYEAYTTLVYGPRTIPRGSPRSTLGSDFKTWFGPATFMLPCMSVAA